MHIGLYFTVWDWTAACQTAQWMNDEFQMVLNCTITWMSYKTGQTSINFPDICKHLSRHFSFLPLSLSLQPAYECQCWSGYTFILTCQSFIFTIWDMTKTLHHEHKIQVHRNMLRCVSGTLWAFVFTLLIIISHCQSACSSLSHWLDVCGLWTSWWMCCAAREKIWKYKLN